MNNKIDFFSGYSLEQINDWYLNLANVISNYTGGQSSAPNLLKYYLTPKAQFTEDTLKQRAQIMDFCRNDIEEQFKIVEDRNGNQVQESNHFGKGINENAGVYIIGDDYLDKLKRHTDYKEVMKNNLSIFLSKSKKYGKSKGIINRVLKEKKDEYILSWYTICSLPQPTKSYLQGKVLLLDKIGVFELSQSDKELFDIYVGLNVFTIKSKVTIAIDKNGWIYDVPNTTTTVSPKNPNSIIISIKSWKNTLVDYYDFDANLGFPLPNPHYGKEGGIRPNVPIVDISKYKLNHDYLVKMIDHKPPLANPFYIYKEFSENTPELLLQHKEIKM